MDKKTSIIFKIIALFYILPPIGYIFLLSFYNKIDPVTALKFLKFNSFNWIMWWVFFISGPIVGFGLLYVKKWGWYAFITHWIAIILSNVYTLISKHTKEEVIFTIICLIGVFSLLYFLLHREIRAPFFNPATRWWDLEGKAKIEMDSLVNFTDQSIDAKIYDISKIGCFLQMEPVYNIGETVIIEIDIERKLRGNLEGNIVWVSRNLKKLPDGIGVKFTKKTKDEKDFLNKIINMLKELKNK